MLNASHFFAKSTGKEALEKEVQAALAKVYKTVRPDHTKACFYMREDFLDLYCGSVETGIQRVKEMLVQLGFKVVTVSEHILAKHSETDYLVMFSIGWGSA